MSVQHNTLFHCFNSSFSALRLTETLWCVVSRYWECQAPRSVHRAITYTKCSLQHFHCIFVRLCFFAEMWAKVASSNERDKNRDNEQTKKYKSLTWITICFSEFFLLSSTFIYYTLFCERIWTGEQFERQRPQVTINTSRIDSLLPPPIDWSLMFFLITKHFCEWKIGWKKKMQLLPYEKKK